MDIASLIQFGSTQLRGGLRKLTSLDEQELGILSDTLRSLEAPFGRSEIRALGEKLNERAPGLSNDEWADVVAVLLQSLGDRDFISFLEDSHIADEKARERLETILEPFKSNHPITKVIEIDRFIEQGPRLTSVICSCDVRTKFSKASDAVADGEQYKPVEEFRLPIATIRMETDELEYPIYFQLTERELSNLVATLETARKQLQYISEKNKEQSHGSAH